MKMEFENKVVVVTGGAHGIGKAIAEAFSAEGAKVVVIDKAEGNHYVGDISKKEVLEKFAGEVIRKYGHVDVMVNNALPLMKGIEECSYEEFQYALAVGVTAPFYLTKLFLPYLTQGASIINISSSRDRMSQPQTESYTAAKGGIAALTHALAVSLAGKARVNSISPGWIDTDYTVYEGADAIQQPAGRVGNPMDIANMVLFLCSDKAGFITGENICIDVGMTKQMIYHGDCGWSLETAPKSSPDAASKISAETVSKAFSKEGIQDQKLHERFKFRTVREGEAETATAIEAACFPPNEACILPIMKERVRLAPELFVVAQETATGKVVGFINAIATDEEHLRDEFFTDTSLHNPKGKYVMILSVAVLPEYRGQGLAKEMMQELLKKQKGMGRTAAVLTCLESKIKLYEKMGYTDLGVSGSEWGGEKWHEMICLTGG